MTLFNDLSVLTIEVKSVKPTKECKLTKHLHKLNSKITKELNYDFDARVCFAPNPDKLSDTI